MFSSRRTACMCALLATFTMLAALALISPAMCAKPIIKQSEIEPVEEKVNLFDKRVFDSEWYLREYQAALAPFGYTEVVDARRHWVDDGLKSGLRGSPNFSARVYLAKNKDVSDMFGKENYPEAIIHYLRYGVKELYRETGGPLRLNIFDVRVFNWRYYVQRNAPNMQSMNISTAAQAKDNWRHVGLAQGWQASPNLNLAVYMENAPELQHLYGEKNYAAALSHWLSIGHKQTWRKNGGSTCAYWATWCGKSAFVQKMLNERWEMPKYNSTGTSLEHPPLPLRAGRSMSVNGRRCSDEETTRPYGPGTTRVVRTTVLRFAGVSSARQCDVTIQHYVDIQTRVKNKPLPELAIKQWDFDNSMPDYVVRDRPLKRAPRQYKYAGFFVNSQPGHISSTFDPKSAQSNETAVYEVTVSRQAEDHPAMWGVDVSADLVASRLGLDPVTPESANDKVVVVVAAKVLFSVDHYFVIDGKQRVPSQVVAKKPPQSLYSIVWH